MDRKIKMQVVFPENLLVMVDQIVSRRKRSEFIVAATQKELKRQHLTRAMEKAAGAWKDAQYPELSTLKDVHHQLSEIHKDTGKRIEQLHG